MKTKIIGDVQLLIFSKLIFLKLWFTFIIIKYKRTKFKACNCQSITIDIYCYKDCKIIIF